MDSPSPNGIAVTHCLNWRALQAERPSMLFEEYAETWMTGRSVHYIARTISAIFNQAIEDGFGASNPAPRPGRYVKIDDRRGHFGFLTPAEGWLFLETAKKHTAKYYPIFLTALRTRMRQGEILGLRWGDSDWNGKFIEIRRASWNRIVTTPKSGKGRRVEMSDQLAEVLSENRVTLAYVKEQLGHHSIQITVDTYGHLVPGANRKAVNTLDDPGWDLPTPHNPERIDAGQETAISTR